MRLDMFCLVFLAIIQNGCGADGSDEQDAQRLIEATRRYDSTVAKKMETIVKTWGATALKKCKKIIDFYDNKMWTAATIDSANYANQYKEKASEECKALRAMYRQSTNFS